MGLMRYGWSLLAEGIYPTSSQRYLKSELDFRRTSALYTPPYRYYRPSRVQPWLTSHAALAKNMRTYGVKFATVDR